VSAKSEGQDSASGDPAPANPAESTAEVADPAPSHPASIVFPKRIVLTGFMGAGKTTVGQLLARRLNWRFLDVDIEIEAAAESSIADLFLIHGEPWFRQVEYDTICRLADSEHVVLALGGGAIEDERTRQLLLQAEETQLVHLHASLGTVLVRCKGTDDLRPVLRDRANLEARYERRLPLYRLAHLTIAVDSLLPEAVVDSILEQIGIASQV